MTDNNENALEAARRLLEQLAPKSEKLLKEVARLRADVKRLADRIYRADTENSDLEDDFYFDKVQQIRNNPPKVTLAEAISDIANARKSIRNIEFDIQSIRGRIDTILNDSVSREEMKKYMIDPNNPKSKRL